MITQEQAQEMVIDFSIRALVEAARRLIDHSPEASNNDVILAAHSGLIDWSVDTDYVGYLPLPTEVFNTLTDRIDAADQSLAQEAGIVYGSAPDNRHNGYYNAETFRVAVHFANERNAYTYLKWLRAKRGTQQQKLGQLENFFKGLKKYSWKDTLGDIDPKRVNFQEVYDSIAEG